MTPSKIIKANWVAYYKELSQKIDFNRNEFCKLAKVDSAALSRYSNPEEKESPSKIFLFKMKAALGNKLDLNKIFSSNP